MNVLIVHAHENPASFCSALANTAKKHLMAQEHSVVITDLYKKQFNPVGGKHDFTQLSNAPYYKYALEQMHANKNGSFVPQLLEERNQLEVADVLIFNFPLWWFGLPAILKGWVDRVLSYGFAYGGEYGVYKQARFQGKQAFLCLTTGSPVSFYTEEGIHGRSLEAILKNIHQGILEIVGYEVLPPFVGYGVSRITDDERATILKQYHQHLEAYLK